MVIRVRGKIKWQPASFIPLAYEIQRSMFKDQERQSKPIIDEYEMEEFYQRIYHALEYHLPGKDNGMGRWLYVWCYWKNSLR